MSFRDEMNEQPMVLRNCVETLFEKQETTENLRYMLRNGKYHSFIFTGMGSSLYAGYIPVYYLRQKGIHAAAMETEELIQLKDSLFNSETLLVAVSQSGESPEVIDLISKFNKKNNFIAVTNYPKSRLNALSNFTVPICAGTEYYTSTKTYTNTLAVMNYLSFVLSGEFDKLESLGAGIKETALEIEEILAQESLENDMADFLADIEFLICVGSGYSYTTASHSEVITEEAAKIYSSRYTPAQFIHGPIELIKRGFGVVLYDFNPLFHKRCTDVCSSVLRYGGKVLYITNNSEIKPEKNKYIRTVHADNPFISPLAEIIPLEAAIDTLVTRRGLETGKLSRVIKRMAI
ncbi:SIS domain-containing protein [Treponema sp. OttesenSCG-928-L16]|nr:SIS domain-containing protein [Treponema sp. OttesenSCG-928-L16]